MRERNGGRGPGRHRGLIGASRPRVGGPALVAAVAILLLVGLTGCGGDRPGTKIEWHPGTPGPDALAADARALPPTPAP